MNPFRKTIFRYLVCAGSGKPKIGGARGMCSVCRRASVPVTEGDRQMVAGTHMDMRLRQPVRVWRWHKLTPEETNG